VTADSGVVGSDCLTVKYSEMKERLLRQRNDGERAEKLKKMQRREVTEEKTRKRRIVTWGETAQYTWQVREADILEVSQREVVRPPQLLSSRAGVKATGRMNAPVG